MLDHPTRGGLLRLLTASCPLIVALCAAGCLMTADENLWKDAGQLDLAPHHDAAGDAPGQDAPGTDAPGADAPGADAPGTDAPGKDAPGTDAPGKDAPPPDTTPPDTKPPPPDATCLQAVLKVAAPADDGEIWGTDLYQDGESGKIWAGYWSAKSEWAYFRFKLSKAIPSGAKVVDAKLSLFGTAEDNWNASSNALEVWAEQSANAAVVTGGTEAPYQTGGRTLTSASVRWPATGALKWIINSTNTSPNLAKLIQEVINSSGGLAAAAYVQIWTRAAQTTQADVACHDYKQPGYSSNPSTLTISWCQ